MCHYTLLMSRTARLFQLMQSLRTLAPPATATQLAQELQVSQRTIYRDIETLRGLGAIIDGEAGFGFTLIEDATLPPLSFDDDELEALVLGLREVGQVGDPALATSAKSALAKLKARLPARQAHRLAHAVLTARHFTPLPKPGIDARALRHAAWDEAQISFHYTDAKDAQTTRTADPLAIVYMQSSHCLLAYCHLRKDYRAFRLDRMRTLTLTGTSFRPKRVAMLRDCLAKMHPQKTPS